MIGVKQAVKLILASSFLHRVDSNSHRLSCCSAVLAAAGQRMQGCSGLGFLSAINPFLALCFVERKETQCQELLIEKKDVWGSYWPVTASTVCNGPKQSWGHCSWEEKAVHEPGEEGGS